MDTDHSVGLIDASEEFVGGLPIQLGTGLPIYSGGGIGSPRNYLDDGSGNGSVQNSFTAGTGVFVGPSGSILGSGSEIDMGTATQRIIFDEGTLSITLNSDGGGISINSTVGNVTVNASSGGNINLQSDGGVYANVSNSGAANFPQSVTTGTLQTTTAAGSSPDSITPSGSPFAYTNSDGYTEMVTVAGGTVSSIAYNGTAIGLILGNFVLKNGDTLTVTYAVAPTMKKWSI